MNRDPVLEPIDADWLTRKTAGLDNRHAFRRIAHMRQSCLIALELLGTDLDGPRPDGWPFYGRNHAQNPVHSRT